MCISLSLSGPKWHERGRQNLLLFLSAIVWVIFGIPLLLDTKFSLSFGEKRMARCRPNQTSGISDLFSNTPPAFNAGHGNHGSHRANLSPICRPMKYSLTTGYNISGEVGVLQSNLAVMDMLYKVDAVRTTLI
ncbi:hypothetical protein B0H16DRAFT_1467348 [Mycena metata]|uniref:Uncharacterized protein n=1 Tax=Mycena metata TaxID=1033252 RepID=A0AAD7MVZ5_9AGAR|nr:hypothetical protein B0H16DRAFT_1467348 [Mycena metata]